MSPRYDVAIVGGGIVGLATALALVQRSRGSVVVLEAEGRLAAHQSGHNSGVIHSGLYYKPGSLKAQTCTAGREALYRFCLEEGIPHRRCGKVVVATRPEQLALLELLEQRGRANGLQRLRRLGSEALREREPEVAGLAGGWGGGKSGGGFCPGWAAAPPPQARGRGGLKTDAPRTHRPPSGDRAHH